MILEILLCLAFTYFVHGKDFDIIFKLDPKQIVDTLQSETSLKYLTKLAEIFGKKVAESFINEIKKNERLITEDIELNNKNNRVLKPMLENEYILNEEEAYKLLEKPSPDGDNLGWHSTSGGWEEYKKKDVVVPPFGLTKVNGIYVRRLLVPKI